MEGRREEYAIGAEEIDVRGGFAEIQGHVALLDFFVALVRLLPRRVEAVQHAGERTQHEGALRNVEARLHRLQTLDVGVLEKVGNLDRNESLSTYGVNRLELSEMRRIVTHHDREEGIDDGSFLAEHAIELV